MNVLHMMNDENVNWGMFQQKVHKTSEDKTQTDCQYPAKLRATRRKPSTAVAVLMSTHNVCFKICDTSISFNSVFARHKNVCVQFKIFHIH